MSQETLAIDEIPFNSFLIIRNPAESDKLINLSKETQLILIDGWIVQFLMKPTGHYGKQSWFLIKATVHPISISNEEIDLDLWGNSAHFGMELVKELLTERVSERIENTIRQGYRATEGGAEMMIGGVELKITYAIKLVS